MTSAPSVKNTKRYPSSKWLSSRKVTSLAKAFFMPIAVIVYC